MVQYKAFSYPKQNISVVVKPISGERFHLLAAVSSKYKVEALITAKGTLNSAVSCWLIDILANINKPALLLL
jgi:hypothetical protein